MTLPLLSIIFYMGLNENKFVNQKEKDEYEVIKSNGTFDAAYYKEANGDLKNSNKDFDLLLHYVRYGKEEGRLCSIPLIQTSYEVEKNVEDINQSIIEDYEVIKASNLFNTSYYLNSYPDVRNVGINPLEHFCLNGWQEIRNPNEDFNTKYYLEKHRDVNTTGMNPFVHWIKYGINENRFINTLTIDTEVDNEINNPSIIFISHEASQTGAPAVLISLMKWVKKNTDIDFSIIIGQSGPLE